MPASSSNLFVAWRNLARLNGFDFDAALPTVGRAVQPASGNRERSVRGAVDQHARAGTVVVDKLYFAFGACGRRLAFTSITSMLTMWLFRVILGYIMGIVLGWSILGVWLAMNCEWGVRGAVFLWRFRGKKWYAHKLI